MKTQKLRSMKNQKLILMAFIFAGLLTSCSDDDSNPEPINEEEVITTMIVTLTADGTSKELKVTDSDGPEGPEDPVFETEDLEANTVYAGSVEFLNELEDPAENITLEVDEEDEEHQVFYETSGGLNVDVEYLDQDPNGNPVGLDFELTTGDTSSGSLTVTLLHEPNKDAAGVSEGDPSNAGGETDITATFDVEIDSPEPINEEEVITSMTVTLTDPDGTIKQFQVIDDDGNGPNVPQFSADDLDANTVYAGSVELLNELEDPVEDITEKLAEEDLDYQLFYVPSGGLDVDLEYLDEDLNGNPVGLDFELTTGDASSGNLTVTLVHEGNKDAAGVSEGDPSNAGGETDIEATFDVVIN